MSQLTLSTEKISSFCFIVKVKPVSGDPPLSGATQDITTSSGTHVVTGGYGYAGG